jgi:hypothetical protein
MISALLTGTDVVFNHTCPHNPFFLGVSLENAKRRI